MGASFETVTMRVLEIFNAGRRESLKGDKTMKQCEKKELASRFSREDWQRLCANGKFLLALCEKSMAECEVIAETLIADWTGLNK